jgi:NADPH:quinone reductase-like Zn-dependent oxidoreductase
MEIAQSKLNLGLECAGLITRTSENAKHNFQLGDFVLCWSPGSLATHVQVDANYCVKIPDGLPFVEAVTLLTGHATMIRGLMELCSLEHGESILIHSGAGADGLAAIQIARIIGAKV